MRTFLLPTHDQTQAATHESHQSTALQAASQVNFHGPPSPATSVSAPEALPLHGVETRLPTSAEGASSQPRGSAIDDNPQPPSSTADASHQELPGSSTPMGGRAGEHADGDLPSKYLRSRCFLCFGKPHDDADAEGYVTLLIRACEAHVSS